MITVAFPLTQKQATAVVVAADAFGVEPWEMALHALNWREYALGRSTFPRPSHKEPQ